MNLVVLSDLHLNPNSAERNQNFLEFLRAARDHKDRVLIVGDLFDLWLGWDNLTLEFQKPILKRMQELAASGLHIDYVEGNRDFGISKFRGSLFQNVFDRAYQFTWGGKKIHAEHGDLINLSDRPYRIWRSVSKNQISYLLLDHLPAFLTLRLATRLESGMKGTNLKHKMNYPEQNAENFYMERFNSGMDVVIVGHFHVQKSLTFHLGNRIVLFYNLPGWEQGFCYLVIPPDGEKPYFKGWGKENGNSATS